jgi:hypothetical protein
MSKIQDIKREIDKTSADLQEKVEMIQLEAQETVEMVKEMIEQGAAQVHQVVQNVSPIYQMRKHPGIAQGVLFGLGFLLARNTRSTRSSFNDVTTKTLHRHGPRAKALLQPIVVGVAGAVAGEILKKRLPMFESRLGALQSALITEMSHKFLQEV